MNGMLTSASVSRVSRYLRHQTKSHLAIPRCRLNSTQPFRSLLYVPASNTRALEKVSTFQGSNQPDAIMLDLEDGVAPTSKDSARENLVKYFQRDHDGSSSIFHIVRINSVDSPWFTDDVSAVAQLVESDAGIAVCLPKIESLDDIEFVSKELRDRCGHGGKDTEAAIMPKYLWPMIETPRAILTSLSISSHPSVHGLILGTNDLSKYLNIEIGQGTREGLTYSLQMAILAAKANDKVVIDGVYNNFHDGEGLQQECVQGKKFGMDGKTLIHPNQVQIANEVFAPSDKEVEHARRVIISWEEASKKKDFTGVAVLEGSGMIEELHVKSARTLLGRAEKISQMGNN